MLFRGIQAAHIYVTSANAGAAVLRDGVLRPPSAVICVAALPMPVLPIPRELGLTIRPSRLVIRKVRHRTLAQAPRHPDHDIPMNLRYLCCQAAQLRLCVTAACILQRCRTWSAGCDGSRTHPEVSLQLVWRLWPCTPYLAVISAGGLPPRPPAGFCWGTCQSAYGYPVFLRRGVPITRSG